jgi:Na+-driven multidrug efflux pump
LFTETITLFYHWVGVAVGAGWQSVVAYVNITTYYLIGIPLGGILGYALGYHVKVRQLI